MTFFKPALFTSAALAMAFGISLGFTSAQAQSPAQSGKIVVAEAEVDAMGSEEEVDTSADAEVDAMGSEEEPKAGGEEEVEAMGVEDEIQE